MQRVQVNSRERMLEFYKRDCSCLHEPKLWDETEISKYTYDIERLALQDLAN
jgi:hypothetical protein